MTDKTADEVKRNSDIRVSVTRSDGMVEAIRWEADDAPEPGPQEAKALILALWDGEARSSLRFDLWTKDMTVEDMNDFFFQTLLTMADTYKNATNNRDLMAEIKIFAREFAEKASQFEKRQGQRG